jgi:hypothetical protein
MDGGATPAPGARSISVQRNLAQLIAAGSTSPSNQVRVWANPTTSFGGAVGGYFIVQYY